LFQNFEEEGEKKKKNFVGLLPKEFLLLKCFYLNLPACHKAE